MFNGWITPEGLLEPAGDYEHEKALARHGLDWSSADRLGWLHVGGVDGVYCAQPPTLDQLDMLEFIYLDSSPEMKRRIDYFKRYHPTESTANWEIH